MTVNAVSAQRTGIAGIFRVRPRVAFGIDDLHDFAGSATRWVFDGD